ncbi:Glucosamine 6-phosphate N-acetyltransferase 1 [Vanrija pseudolonga]|uniref:Glucosamine 6-phosphate N-acetyltransferase n=1 Tax=Vanrija pseudolonga TaxID=143232 RepID=A0AAF0YGK5_9TREE|nr:Glucosamine 6-phosphate N-acetyltransferase 1 [Vanrija pseudolonga]
MPARPDEFLFPASDIPASVKAALGDDLELRPLAISDHARGHFELLTVLTAAPNIGKDAYIDRFEYLRSCPNTYYTVVIVHKATDQLVAVGTVFVERKFTRSGGLVAHIEDIAVSKKMQGRKLGLLIIKTLEELGRQAGCYKVILDCSKENIAFYEKCGRVSWNLEFKHKEYEMVMYLDSPPALAAATPAPRL